MVDHMGLKMLTLLKHPKSSNHWFRKRVPERVRAFEDGRTEIRESLGTADAPARFSTRLLARRAASVSHSQRGK